MDQIPNKIDVHLRPVFLSKFDAIVRDINHSDIDGKDWTNPDKIGGLAQSIPEWRAFMEFISAYFMNRDIENPTILEIGSQDGHQRRFYEELLNAEYIGIDIDEKAKGDVDILGDSTRPETVEKVKERLDGRNLDLVFIDGDHSYHGTKADYLIYGPMARHIICLHDIFNRLPRNPNFPPVETYLVWDEICRSEMRHTLLTFHKNRTHERDPWVELGIGVVIKDGK